VIPVGVAYGLLGITAAAMAAAVTFAVLNSRARDQREAARVLASSTAGELVRAKEAIERLTKNLKSEQESTDALDDELAEARKSPNPVGARDRVLAKWEAKRAAARGDGTSPLPSSTAATDPGPDGLLNPFAGG
jgi:hypothetical protein